MNVNEVLAGRANEILTGSRGGKDPVHPNDHVNAGQSSNDTIPSAIRIAAVTGIEHRLRPALNRLGDVLTEKATAFADIKKIGRTHLQDAVPMTLGQAFSGYARQARLSAARARDAVKRLQELALGGTAVGTGTGTFPEFAPRVIEAVNAETGFAFVEAENHFESQAAQDAAVEASGALRGIAVSLAKIAEDIRWLASGPRCGIGEIRLPALQPGSSIMPGKVNPVMCESVLQVSAQVTGNDTAVALGGRGGVFELNTMLPVIGHNLLQSIDLLASAARLFADTCVSGIAANRDRCEGYVEKSLSLAAVLIPRIGYDRAAEISRLAHETGKTIREVAAEEGVLPDSELDRLLDF
jgi:fumarate hydratase class II